MRSCGNTAIKGWSGPNFWANLASFSLMGLNNVFLRQGSHRNDALVGPNKEPPLGAGHVLAEGAR